MWPLQPLWCDNDHVTMIMVTTKSHLWDPFCLARQTLANVPVPIVWSVNSYSKVYFKIMPFIASQYVDYWYATFIMSSESRLNWASGSRAPSPSSPPVASSSTRLARSLHTDTEYNINNDNDNYHYYYPPPPPAWQGRCTQTQNIILIMIIIIITIIILLLHPLGKVAAHRHRI